MRRGVGLAVLGAVVGLAGAVALTRAMASLRFGVGALDPATCATVSALLVVVATAASYIPARRASGQDGTRAMGPIGCLNAR